MADSGRRRKNKLNVQKRKANATGSGLDFSRGNPVQVVRVCPVPLGSFSLSLPFFTHHPQGGTVREVARGPRENTSNKTWWKGDSPDEARLISGGRELAN